MPSRPWYPKYPSDYLSDTAFFTLEEHGFYGLLLDYLWQNEGFLPQDCNQIAHLMRLDSRKVKRLLEGSVGKKLKRKGKMYYNERLLKEYVKAVEKSEKARQSALQKYDKLDGKNGSERRANGGQGSGRANGVPPQSQPQSQSEKHIKELSVWKDYVAHRKDIKKPLTERAETLSINKLIGFSDEQIESIINETIEKGWTGLFPPKETPEDDPFEGCI